MAFRTHVWSAGKLLMLAGALLLTYLLFAAAAMRVALPQANPALSLTLSLGVTFPFNLIFGIPLYLAMAELAARA